MFLFLIFRKYDRHALMTANSSATNLRRVFVKDMTSCCTYSDLDLCVYPPIPLAHYGLVVDLQDEQLIDKTILLSSKGQEVKCANPCVKAVCNTTNKLRQFPEITRPNGLLPILCGNTKHNILTSVTSVGPPITCKARCLGLDAWR